MKNKTAVRVGGVNEHFNLPWIKLNEEKDSKNQFELEWKSYAGGTGVLTSALQNDEIDIAVLLTEGLLLDILKNDHLRLICFHVTNPLRWAIHVRQKDSVSGFSFEKKRFAISRMGSGSHTMAKFLLNEKNIGYDEKMMVEVGSLERGLQALENNSADIFLWEKFTTEPFLQKYGLAAIGEVKTPWPPFSVAATRKFKTENSDLIAEIISAVKDHSRRISSDPATLSEISERWQITSDNASQWLNEIEWDDQIPVKKELLASVLDNMKKAGLIDVLPDDMNQFLN